MVIPNDIRHHFCRPLANEGYLVQCPQSVGFATHIWKNHLCAWKEWNNFQAEPRRTSVWQLGFALDPPGKLASLPQTSSWWRGVAAICPKTGTPLMVLLTSSLWINVCSIINLAFIIATASSCNDTVNYITKSNIIERLQDDNLLIIWATEVIGSCMYRTWQKKYTTMIF